MIYSAFEIYYSSVFMSQSVFYFICFWWLLSWLPPLKLRFKSPFPYWAMTIAPIIFINAKYPDIPEWVEKHEMRHVWQQRIISPALMLLLYLLSFIVLYIWFLFKERNLRKAYNKAYFYIPFEIDARCHGGWYPEQKCI